MCWSCGKNLEVEQRMERVVKSKAWGSVSNPQSPKVAKDIAVRKLRMRQTCNMIRSSSKIEEAENLETVLKELNVSVDSHLFDGITPLAYAVDFGHDKAVKLLLDAGANAGYVDTYKYTPLGRAVLKEDRVIVKMILLHTKHRLHIFSDDGKFESPAMMYKKSKSTQSQKILADLLRYATSTNAPGNKPEEELLFKTWHIPGLMAIDQDGYDLLEDD